MAKVKLNEQEKQTILYELLVKHLPKHLIKDWKDVQFDNGKGVPPLIYIVVQSRIPGETVLHTNTFSVNRNHWNKQICSLSKIK
jgi:hypothetical protein